MSKILDFDGFLNEKKKSPYDRDTLKVNLQRWKKGKKIAFGIENTLKAQGLIPRANGKIEVSDEYKDDDSILAALKPKESKKKESKKSKEKDE
jgi:hypothetical protein